MAGDSEKLTLQVKDFGPIAEGEVDLRPLTVFIGPSNTGKSYLATLIYALHRFFSGDGQVISNRGYPLRYRSLFYRTRGSSISDEEAARLFEWVRETFSEKRVDSTKKRMSEPLPDDIADMVRPAFYLDKRLPAFFEEQIVRLYGIEEIHSLVRYPGSEGAEASFQRYVDNELVYDCRFNIDDKKASIATSVPDAAPMRFEISSSSSVFRRSILYASRETTAKERRNRANYHIAELAEKIYPYVTGSMSNSSHSLPAARTGIMHAHHVIMSAMIERATVAGIHPSAQLPTLNGVLADFLKTLMSIGRLARRTEPGKEITALAKSLEKNVLRGSVNLKESPVPNVYPSFVYRPDGWDRDLPLMNTASMISELAPLVLYLRHVVQPGDTLIIEEPEAHLHPAMQAAVIRELAKAVHAGVRIIITTHSEWIMEALQNIALASKLPEDKRGGVSLEPENLGVWTFQHEKETGGSVVKELPFDPEIGFDTEDYSQVAADLHNQWANISSEIERNETR